MIQAVLFDLDGVLVDADEWHFITLNYALGHFGFTISPTEHTELFNGLPTRTKLTLLTERKGLPIRLHEEIHRLKQSYTQKAISKLCRPDPVKREMMMKLRQDGYLIGVCTNAIRESLDQMLIASELEPLVDYAVSSEEVKKPKPAPDVYLSAFDAFSLKPDQCIILEDSNHGREAARKSGAYLLEVGSYREVTYQFVVNGISTLNESNRRDEHSSDDTHPSWA